MLNRIMINGMAGATIGASAGATITAYLYLTQNSNDKTPKQDISSVWIFSVVMGFSMGVVYGAADEFIIKNNSPIPAAPLIPAPIPSPVPVVVPLTLFRTAAKEAQEIFVKEDRSPLNKSQLGGRFGLFSSIRHKPTTASKFVAALSHCTTDQSAKDFIMNSLKAEGSLWHPSAGFNHSFNNYFLTCLRHQNIDVYRDIVGKTFGIKFISGPITLYRRDTRESSVIFKNGFQLKPWTNSFNVRKNNYAQPATFGYGVSFSKKIPPTHYGNRNSYYEVELGVKQNFLLIDIANSPCNNEKLTQYHINLQEVNSLDPIPAAAIKTFVQEGIGLFNHRLLNNKFSPNTLNENKKSLGCY